MALKIGLVGVGGIGKLHLKCYKEDPLAEVVAVADAVIEKAEEVAKEYGIKAYRSVQEMLDAHPDIDIVDVSTGGHENGSWHYEPVMAALERKKHVIVEKPLSNDLQEAREMVAKADEVGVYFACNLNHYFTPPAEEAKRLIESGELGELRYCLMKMGFSGGEPLYGGPAKDRGLRTTRTSTRRRSSRIPSASCGTSAATSWRSRPSLGGRPLGKRPEKTSSPRPASTCVLSTAAPGTSSAIAATPRRAWEDGGASRWAAPRGRSASKTASRS